MVRIRGIYEIAIPVKELPRAENFYRSVLGLEVGLRDETRKWLFLRAGGAAGMIVLQEKPDDWMPARSVYLSDVDGHRLELCATVE